ncbi:MAG: aminotransferase class V-fold PLP-dependent enzyme, partial [Gammaproteobacteria bacterium]
MRVYNFSAGPAALPLPVLEQARDELTDWRGGMSVMEVSHRGKAFIAVAQQAEADLRELLAIPPGYKVLFMQGGATAQFAAVPLNLAAASAAADYVNTGHWSQRTIAEAKRFVDLRIAADESAGGYTTVPRQDTLALTPGAAFLHYTPNETIHGVEFPYIPDAGQVPLVADMSSTILSRPLDVARFGVI